MRRCNPRCSEAIDPQATPPQVVGGRSPQWKRRDLPEIEPAIQWCGNQLPVADNGLFGVPAHRVVGVVGPDSQWVAELVGNSVAVGDDDIARPEALHVIAHGEYFPDSAVTRVNLPPPVLRDIGRVRESSVLDIVFGGNREDSHVDV